MSQLMQKLPYIATGLLILCCLADDIDLSAGADADRLPPIAGDRSPVDLVVGADESWLVTVNQTSNSLSLIRATDGQVLDEVSIGRRPSAIAASANGRTLLVTATYWGDLVVLKRLDDRLETTAKIHLGFEPRGVAFSPDEKLAYVALTAADEVAVVDLEKQSVVRRIAVGRWPRYLTVSSDGSRLAVGTSGSKGVTVVDLSTSEALYQEKFVGLNLGHMQISADGKYVYFPWMVYGTNPISEINIQRGWVLASRIARVRLDGPARREAISLDPKGEAIADPHGLAMSKDEQRLVVTASGSQELLVYQLPTLPFQDYGGPGDHIDAGLLADKNRFFRIPLGGRPMNVQLSADGQRAYVANYLSNSVQIVDLAERKVTRTIDVGHAAEISLARRGEAIFYDGRRSLDQWYSCHTCHYEGGTNSVTIDTQNDGSNLTYKTVLELHNLEHTGPWTWHGWQTDLKAAMHKSLTETMRGPQPSAEDTEALLAFIRTLVRAPNSRRTPDGGLSEAAERGRGVFNSDKAGCSNCHSGEYLTDGQVHELGLTNDYDRYSGSNTPSLLGVSQRILLMHDGRATSFEELLNGPHNPAQVTGQGELSADDRRDLIEYLRSL